MEPIKTVVVGLGYAGQGIHVPVVANNDRAVLAGVFDPRKGFSNKVIKVFRKRNIISNGTNPAIYETYDQVLKDDDVDAVILCTPHELHIPMTKQTLETGKAVLGEKPMCTTFEAGKEFFEYIKNSGYASRLAIGYMWPFDAAVTSLRDMIDSGVHGFSRLPVVASQYFLTGDYDSWLAGFKPIKGGKNPPHETVRPALLRNEIEKKAYEWLINVWSHASNLFQVLFSAPEAVSDVNIWNRGESFSWTETHGGFRSINYCSWVTGSEFWRGIKVHYPISTFELQLLPPMQKAPARLWITEDDTTTEQKIETTPATSWSYSSRFEGFLDLIAGNGKYTVEQNLSDLSHAVVDLELAEAIIRSFQERKPIALDDASNTR